jgi:hypothetical protein
LTSAGFLALAARVWLYGYPLRRGYLPAVGTWLLLSMGLLVVTGLLVRLVWRHFRWVARRDYQRERFPDAALSRMAIELRKKEVLSRFWSVEFLVPRAAGLGARVSTR